MSLIAWLPVHSVGVKVIDTQHQYIFNLINRLYELMQQNQAREESAKILAELTAYAVFHFNTEEAYFRQFQYPLAAAHTQAHAAFKDKIHAFTDRVVEGDHVTLPYDLIDFLEDWWLAHVTGMDRQYIQCFHDHGLT